MSISKDLAEKSLQAAVSAIEIYNKPNFSYREEAFSLLMSNAWELLLKGKWLLNHSEKIDSLYVLVDNGTGKFVPKLNRSGNPLTHSVTTLSAWLLGEKNSGLKKECHDNILALVQIRDNAAHFLSKDLYLGRRILEIGTASLANYLSLASEWFQLDFSNYNFFLMPISFYHGFESVEPTSRVQYPDQIQKLLQFLDSLEKTEDPHSTQHVALRLETKLVRGKDAKAVAFRWTDEPSAPYVTVREEDVLKQYPLTYRDLTEKLNRRYSDFCLNGKYHKIRKGLEKETKFAIVRKLNPTNLRSARQTFYNPNIFQEFDKQYKLRAQTRLMP